MTQIFDVDGDGLMDLVYMARLRFYWQKQIPSGTGVTFLSKTELVDDFSTNGFAFADINGDGVIDLVAGEYSGSDSVFAFLGVESVSPEPPLPSVPSSTNDSASGDDKFSRCMMDTNALAAETPALQQAIDNFGDSLIISDPYVNLMEGKFNSNVEYSLEEQEALGLACADAGGIFEADSNGQNFPCYVDLIGDDVKFNFINFASCNANTENCRDLNNSDYVKQVMESVCKSSSKGTVTPVPAPSTLPTDAPVVPAPVPLPTDAPITLPTDAPVVPAPVPLPTDAPITLPTDAPVVPAPVPLPTDAPITLPTDAPVVPAPVPAPMDGTVNLAPVSVPTDAPGDVELISTLLISASPSDTTKSPTDGPTTSPTRTPSYLPTNKPTVAPTDSPTDGPTTSPTGSPTDSPSSVPVSNPPSFVKNTNPTLKDSGANGNNPSTDSVSSNSTDLSETSSGAEQGWKLFGYETANMVFVASFFVFLV